MTGSGAKSENEMHRYRCSNCGGVWMMDDRPSACPHCRNDVIAGYREIVTREVGVRGDGEEDDEVLPEFEELFEG